MKVDRFIRKIGWLALGCLLGIAAMVTAGCVLPDGTGYYDEEYDAPYGGYYNGGAFGYYEPYEYRGWGPGYQVGPFGNDFDRDRFEHGEGRGRGGDEGFEHGRFEHGGGERRGGGMHSFRSAPASRPIPSIPSRGRGHGRAGRR